MATAWTPYSRPLSMPTRCSAVYCTCGIVMAAKQLLAENPNPDEETIRKGISGNLCRCTGYQKIVEAVQIAAVS